MHIVPALGPMMAAPAVSSFRKMIQDAGQDTNLLLCLDAAVSSSYPGSGTTWTDLSGNSRDVTLSGTVTFNGSANGGSANEYLTFNGGYGTVGGDLTAFDPFHKDGGICTIMAVIRRTSTNEAHVIGNNTSSTSTQGFRFLPKSDVQHNVFEVANGTSTVLSKATSNTLSGTNTTLFCPASVHNENAGATGDFLWTNGALDTVTGGNPYNGNLTSPSASNAAGPPRISSYGPASGTGKGDYFCLAVWNRALTSTNLNSIYTQLKTRYAALP